MPLAEGSGQETISANIAELIRAGHEKSQAAAIAYKKARGDSEAPVAPGSGALGRAAGILFRTGDGEHLFMHRGDGGDYPLSWGLPGGHQEEGETLEECARREAAEETGLKYDGPLKKLHDDGQFCTYLAKVDDKFPVTLCDESAGFTWATTAPEPAHPGLAAALRVADAHTELDIAELVRDGVLPSPQWFSNCYLLDLRITGTGQSFRSEVKDEAGTITRAREHVYRDDQFYLNPRFLARCNGLSVVIDHPEAVTLTGEEYMKRVAGAVMLPYLKGDEVWGVARIYAADVIGLLEKSRMAKKPISTSPGVLFDAASENVTVLLENGDPLLLEGDPKLIDHIAICGLGVWDKGGAATGVSLNNEEDLQMTEAEEKAKKDAEEKARKDSEEKARKDAEEKAEKERKDAEEAFEKRVDAEVKTRMDKSKKDSDEAMADKARRDSEEKAAKDAEEKAEKDRKDAEERARKDAESCTEKMADVQAKADSVFAMLGSSAPRWMNGETVTDYRIRNAKALQKHSPEHKDLNLTAIARADSAGFEMIEGQIFEAAKRASRNPIDLGPGLLQAIRIPSETHRITEYRGDAAACWGPFMREPKRVKLNAEMINRSQSLRLQ